MTLLAEGKRSFPTRSPRHPDFDPRRDFQAVRLVKLGSIQIQPGEPFDKEQVTERLLRQLFDNRQIIMVGDPLLDAVNPAMRRRARIVHAQRDDKPKQGIPRVKRSIPRVKREAGGP
jgi:hypothetical protein